MLLFIFGIRSLIYRLLSKKFDFFCLTLKTCFQFPASSSSYMGSMNKCYTSLESLWNSLSNDIYISLFISRIKSRIQRNRSRKFEFPWKTLKTSFRFLTHNSLTINGNNSCNTSLESWWNSLSNGVYIISFAHKQFDPHLIDFGVKSWHFRAKR